MATTKTRIWSQVHLLFILANCKIKGNSDAIIDMCFLKNPIIKSQKHSGKMIK